MVARPGEDLGNGSPHPLLGGGAGNRVALLNVSDMRQTVQQNHPLTLHGVTHGKGKYMSTQHQHIHVHSTVIHNSQTEAPQMAIR